MQIEKRTCLVTWRQTAPIFLPLFRPPSCHSYDPSNRSCDKVKKFPNAPMRQISSREFKSTQAFGDTCAREQKLLRVIRTHPSNPRSILESCMDSGHSLGSLDLLLVGRAKRNLLFCWSRICMERSVSCWAKWESDIGKSSPLTSITGSNLLRELKLSPNATSSSIHSLEDCRTTSNLDPGWCTLTRNRRECLTLQTANKSHIKNQPPQTKATCKDMWRRYYAMLFPLHRNISGSMQVCSKISTNAQHSAALGS